MSVCSVSSSESVRSAHWLPRTEEVVELEGVGVGTVCVGVDVLGLGGRVGDKLGTGGGVVL